MKFIGDEYASGSNGTQDKRHLPTALKFVESRAGTHITSLERKAIKRHVARGTGRPKQALILKRPRKGAWVRSEPDRTKPEMYVVKRMLLPDSPSMFPGMSGLWIDKIMKSVGQLSQALYPAAFCSVFHIVDTAWFMYLNQDPVHHYVYPYIAELFLVGYSNEAVRMLSKLLPLVQASIEDSSKSATDSTISAVLALATAADISGDIMSLKKHVKGLSSLVDMRGGIPKLLHSELQVKCSRVDIQLSLYTGSMPVFFADNISWEPFFADSSKNKPVSLVPGFSSCTAAVPGVLEPRLKDIWADARELCALVNLASFTGRKIQPHLFQEIMVSLQYRLLHFEIEPTTCQPALTRAIQIGTLAFTTTIFLHIAGIPTRYHWLTAQMRKVLKDYDEPSNAQDWKIKLWLLVTAAITGFGGCFGTLLNSALSKSMTELELFEWQDIKSVLKEYLWIDVLHDIHGKKVTEKCKLQKI